MHTLKFHECLTFTNSYTLNERYTSLHVKGPFYKVAGFITSMAKEVMFLVALVCLCLSVCLWT